MKRKPRLGGGNGSMQLPYSSRDVLVAAAWAALLSGIPSTLHAARTGRDILEPTRAAGAMLVPVGSSTPRLLLAAGLVHGAVTLFWASLFAWVLPRRRTLSGAIVASGAIALLDLRVIGRRYPSVYALPFWPQFADHLAWGATFGAALMWRCRQHAFRYSAE